jgi:haloacetate dehalogenase
VNRRDLLKRAGSAVVVSGFSRTSSAGTSIASAEPDAGASAGQAAPSRGVSPFFPGFSVSTVDTAGARIHVVKGGQGAPLLLLHGAPQTHITWRLVAPLLMKTYTLVIPDLRGYGDSSKPADTPDHSNYSKRNMARDMVEVMTSFGFDRFSVVGQDRGGRVGRRLAVDHPDKVTKLAVLDIVPAHYHYTHVTLAFVQAYPHWFTYLQPAPGPENTLKARNDAAAARASTDAAREYSRINTDMANIHGMCEDYRASASIDLTYDEEDLKAGRKVRCPLLTLWSTRGPIGRLFNVLEIWKSYANPDTVTGKGLDAGHYLQEDAPEAVVAEIKAFLEP